MDIIRVQRSAALLLLLVRVYMACTRYREHI